MPTPYLMFSTNDFLNNATNCDNHCSKTNIMETIGERIEEGGMPFIKARNDPKYNHQWSTDTGNWIKKHKVLDRIIHHRKNFIANLIEHEVDLQEHIECVQGEQDTTIESQNKDILTFINDRLEELTEIVALEDKQHKCLLVL